MTNIDKNERFECRSVNIIDNMKQWKGVTVEDVDSGGRVYFARVNAEKFGYDIGDSLFIGVEELPYGIDEMSVKVRLYDDQDNELDWTILG